MGAGGGGGGKCICRDAEGLNDITLMWGRGDGGKERGERDLLLIHVVTFSRPSTYNDCLHKHLLFLVTVSPFEKL